jgi:hypothetical protein
MFPIAGTGFAVLSLILSMKIRPGSPVLHAPSAISSNTFLAESLPVTSLVFG